MTNNLHKSKSQVISIDEIWNNPKWQIIDARSPKEFSEGKIPGSFNLPLLDNLQRHEIGILYKEFGQDSAINKGYEFLIEKQPLLETQFQRLTKDKLIAVYCARGGLRSQIMTALLIKKGYDAFKVDLGFKGFRSWVLKKLDLMEIPKPYLLCGQTGVGENTHNSRIKKFTGP